MRAWWLLIAASLSVSCVLPELTKIEGTPVMDNGAGNGGAEADAGEGGASPTAGSAGVGTGGELEKPELGLVRQKGSDKLDLLLMIDNSISMADKQVLLGQALKTLLSRLTKPMCRRACTDADDCTAAQLDEGLPTGAFSDGAGSCPVGFPELQPVVDIHVGVVTSSLGAHGGDAKAICSKPDDDDHARLLGEVRGISPTWKESGFLVWDPQARHVPPGSDDLATFEQQVTDMVEAAGETGCGYEASLEAWYRFLADPEPPESVVVTGSTAKKTGLDQALLDQRAAFLRPDSVLAIVMFSDENDCSIMDEGYGWLATRPQAMFRSSSQCLQNPNDPCCQSCGDTKMNPGCPALTQDSECKKGMTVSEPASDDLNLRCWEQKRRFGIDLLYPISRYVDAIQSPVIARDSDGMLVENPIFAHPPGSTARDPRAVNLMGIIGVPWQDLAADESLDGAGLRYLTATELEEQGRWKLMVGDSEASPPVLPQDPFMIETHEDRTTLAAAPQKHPLTADELVAPTSTDPHANAINGHEQHDMGARDLQYACIFPLATPRVCDAAAFNAGIGCDCFSEDLTFNRPLCQAPSGGATTTTQYFAKAYPGLRQLNLLRRLGDRGVPASICPKVGNDSDPAYGYIPAVDALVRQLRAGFGSCIDRALPLAADEESVSCRVFEVTPGAASCDCAARGGLAVSAAVAAAAEAQLDAARVCGDETGTACESVCTCEIPQLTGEAHTACLSSDSVPASDSGFCYVNAMPGEKQVGAPAVVASCAPGQKRQLRFVGEPPALGSVTMIDCSSVP